MISPPLLNDNASKPIFMLFDEYGNLELSQIMVSDVLIIKVVK